MHSALEAPGLRTLLVASELPLSKVLRIDTAKALFVELHRWQAFGQRSGARELQRTPSTKKVWHRRRVVFLSGGADIMCGHKGLLTLDGGLAHAHLHLAHITAGSVGHSSRLNVCTGLPGHEGGGSFAHVRLLAGGWVHSELVGHDGESLRIFFLIFHSMTEYSTIIVMLYVCVSLILFFIV